MRTVDFTPLYRNAIGFDRLLNMMENSAAKTPKADTLHTISSKKKTTNIALPWR